MHVSSAFSSGNCLFCFATGDRTHTKTGSQRSPEESQFALTFDIPHFDTVSVLILIRFRQSPGSVAGGAQFDGAAASRDAAVTIGRKALGSQFVLTSDTLHTIPRADASRSAVVPFRLSRLRAQMEQIRVRNKADQRHGDDIIDRQHSDDTIHTDDEHRSDAKTLRDHEHYSEHRSEGKEKKKHEKRDKHEKHD